jgi:hypothetical protein
MTICTQQFKIASVSLPIGEPARPSPLTILGLNLALRNFVVNIQSAKVGKAAQDTFTTERAHKLQLALPVALPFVNKIAVGIPKGFLAIGRAKPCGGFLPALVALPVVLPSVRDITSMTTKLTEAALHAIKRGVKGLSAVSTVYGDACLFHTHNIAQYIGNVKPPKYCAIAVERMERELSQPCLPTMEPQQAKQEQLL